MEFVKELVKLFGRHAFVEVGHVKVGVLRPYCFCKLVVLHFGWLCSF